MVELVYKFDEKVLQRMFEKVSYVFCYKGNTIPTHCIPILLKCSVLDALDECRWVWLVGMVKVAVWACAWNHGMLMESYSISQVDR